jgi:hypothetical protein
VESAKSDLRLAAMTLLLPLYASVAFATNYVGALHAPAPHGVRVAIVGAPSATAPVARALSRPSGAYDVSQLRSVGWARRLVGERKLAAAYLPASNAPPTVVVATAASPSLAGFVEATFRRAAAAQGRPLAVDDVRPLPPDNATGASNFFFVVVCTLAGLLTVGALGALAPTLPPRRRLAVIAVAAVLAPVVAYLIAGIAYSTFGGSLPTIVALLALGALYSFVVATTIRLMQLGLGALGVLLGSFVCIFLSMPSSGGSVAAQLLPGFWRFLSHFWIGAAALDANRSILYFGGAGVGIDIVKLVGWVVAWGVLLAGPIYVRRTRRPG